jgi:hypothetical protein
MKWQRDKVDIFFAFDVNLLDYKAQMYDVKGIHQVGCIYWANKAKTKVDLMVV